MMKRFFVFLVLSILVFSLGLAFGQEEESFIDLGNLAGFYSDNDLRMSKFNEGIVNQDPKTYSLVVDDSKSKIEFKKEGEEKYRKFSNMKKGSKLTFKEGELDSAEFEVTDSKIDKDCDGDYGGCFPNAVQYKLGDHIYNIPLGSKVSYKREEGMQDVVKIIQKDGTVAYPPKIYPQNKEKKDARKTEVSYDLPENSKAGESLTMVSGGDEYNVYKRDEFDFNLNFDPDSERFFINGAQQIDNLEIGSLQSSKTFLNFGDVEINSDNTDAEIVFGKGENPGLTIASNEGVKGPSVKILPQTAENGNKKYGGLSVEEGDNLVFWAVGEGKDFGTGKEFRGGSKISVKSLEEGKPPLVDTQGNFRIFTGNQLVRFNEHTEGNVKVRTLSDSLSAKSGEKEVSFDFSKSNAVPMQIHVKNGEGKDLVYKDLKSGKELENSDIFVVANKGNLKQGYITTGTKNGFLSKVGVSEFDAGLMAVFNGLTSETQQELLKMGGREMFNELETIRKGKSEISNPVEERNKKDLEKQEPQTQIRSNVLQNLRNVKIPPAAIAQLKKYGGSMVDKDSKNGVMAVVLSADFDCGSCKELKNSVSNNKNRINGRVVSLTHNTDTKAYLSKLGISQITSYPTTAFINTKSGKIIGWEIGSEINFNKYFGN